VYAADYFERARRTAPASRWAAAAADQLGDAESTTSVTLPELGSS
jgi:hypothetical protein